VLRPDSYAGIGGVIGLGFRCFPLLLCGRLVVLGVFLVVVEFIGFFLCVFFFRVLFFVGFGCSFFFGFWVGQLLCF